MAERFRIQVDLDDPIFGEDHGLTPGTLSHLRHVFVQPSSTQAKEVIDFVKRLRTTLEIYSDCTNLQSADDIVDLLNEGCARVIVTESQAAALTTGGYLQPDNLQRLIVDDVSDGKSRKYVLVEDSIEQKYREVVKSGRVAIVPTSKITASPREFPNLFPVHRLITSIIRSDRPDGLYPTIVADQRGNCLGLVYSDDESIERAIETGRGVYHSRSRNGIWIKGEESGDIQELIDISWDCDTDTLRFRVDQKGAGMIFPNILVRIPSLTDPRLLSF